MVSGGIQNIASEDRCIRATGSSNNTKIEVQNTAASGRLFEMRSTNAGNFDIVDRTGGVDRFTILGSRTNFGFNITPAASGDGNIYINNGSAPAFSPATGGLLYVSGGALNYLSQGGKTTILATNL